MTEKDSFAVLGILKTSYPRFYMGMSKEEVDATAALWREMLSDADMPTVAVSLKRLIAACKFPPTIAEVRESISAVTYSALPDEGSAWGEVNHAIRTYGYCREADALASMSETTREAVKSMGWQSLCMSENDMADRAHFLKIYNSITKRIEQDRLLPESLREQIGTIAQARDMDNANALIGSALGCKGARHEQF
jgi:hypothetical protein